MERMRPIFNFFWGFSPQKKMDSITNIEDEEDGRGDDELVQCQLLPNDGQGGPNIPLQRRIHIQDNCLHKFFTCKLII